MKSIVFIATLALIAASVSATPSCWLVEDTHTLWVKDAHTVGAKCYHYAGESTCPCDSGPTTYANGQSLTVYGWDTVQVDPAAAPYHVNLYSGELMTFPTDSCCPPPTFLDPSVECETVTDLGSCCHDGSTTVVTGLPSQAECVHETATYSAGAVTGAGSVTLGTGASSVEVYASDLSGDSCGSHFIKFQFLKIEILI